MLTLCMLLHALVRELPHVPRQFPVPAQPGPMDAAPINPPGRRSTMKFPRTHRMLTTGTAAVGVLALTVTGCGSDDSTSPSGLEKGTITVGMLPVEASAAVKLSVDRGLFKAEGLTVKIQV